MPGLVAENADSSPKISWSERFLGFDFLSPDVSKRFEKGMYSSEIERGLQRVRVGLELFLVAQAQTSHVKSLGREG